MDVFSLKVIKLHYQENVEMPMIKHHHPCHHRMQHQVQALNHIPLIVKNLIYPKQFLFLFFLTDWLIDYILQLSFLHASSVLFFLQWNTFKFVCFWKNTKTRNLNENKSKTLDTKFWRHQKQNPPTKKKFLKIKIETNKYFFTHK